MTDKKRDYGIIFVLLYGILGFCFFGLLIGFSIGNPVSGALWGGGIGLAITIISYIGIYGWEMLQNEMNVGKLYPYITLGILTGALLATLMAFTLGNSSCEEYDSLEPRSSCIQYADDGFEATSQERLEEFWRVFPVAAIIGGLIATIIHHNVHKKK